MILMLLWVIIKKLNAIATELFIRCKVNISLVSITQSYFALPKNVYQILTLKTRYFYEKFIAKSHSFLVIDTILASSDLLRFRKNLLEGL